LTCVKPASAGTLSWPAELSPQQAIDPSLRRAQVWSYPALTCVKPASAGTLSWPSLLLPQQTIEPSLLRAQVWRTPTATWSAAPLAGGSSPFAKAGTCGATGATGSSCSWQAATNSATNRSAARPRKPFRLASITLLQVGSRRAQVLAARGPEGNR